MQNSKSPIATPTVKRRLISMVYEAFLLTAVEALAIFVYLFATRNQHTPTIDHGRNAVFFLVAAAYFIHAWTGSGHTLAMKTWRIKVVKLGYATGAVARRRDALPDGVGLVPAGDRGVLRVRAGRARPGGHGAGGRHRRPGR